MVRDDLRDFFARAAVTDFSEEEFNCGLWLADWYVAATGLPDPASHLRGSPYKPSPHRVRGVIRAAGLVPTRSPRDGDVGLVSPSSGSWAGAIYSGGMAVMLSRPRGLNGIRLVYLRRWFAWEVPCLRS